MAELGTQFDTTTIPDDTPRFDEFSTKLQDGVIPIDQQTLYASDTTPQTVKTKEIITHDN